MIFKGFEVAWLRPISFRIDFLNQSSKNYGRISNGILLMMAQCWFCPRCFMPTRWEKSSSSSWSASCKQSKSGSCFLTNSTTRSTLSSHLASLHMWTLNVATEKHFILKCRKNRFKKILNHVFKDFLFFPKWLSGGFLKQFPHFLLHIIHRCWNRNCRRLGVEWNSSCIGPQWGSVNGL